MRSRLFWTGLAVLFMLGDATGRAACEPLVAGFDRLDVQLRLGHPVPFGACPAVPTPIADMGAYESVYDPKDPTQSHVVAEREAQAKKRDDVFMAFSTQLNQLSNKALLATPPNKALADCVFHQLATWARANAGLENIDNNDRVGRRVAIMMQAWHGAAYANAVLQTGGLADQDAEDVNAIRAWLLRLATSVKGEFSGQPPWVKLDHNHAYWAAYAVASIGVVLNDRGMFAFGRQELGTGLASVAADGSLPTEMERGGRAFQYQQFATLPLAGLVALADRNGAPLNESEEAALERLVGFDARGVVSLDEAAKLAGVKQMPAAHSFELSWVDMLLPHFRQRKPTLVPSLETLVAAPGMRPSYFVYLGGDVTSAYNPNALPSHTH